MFTSSIAAHQSPLSSKVSGIVCVSSTFLLHTQVQHSPLQRCYCGSTWLRRCSRVPLSPLPHSVRLSLIIAAVESKAYYRHVHVLNPVTTSNTTAVRVAIPYTNTTDVESRFRDQQSLTASIFIKRKRKCVQNCNATHPGALIAQAVLYETAFEAMKVMGSLFGNSSEAQND